jgi:predicted RNA binding protein YcfA (HicA-like mRNA interferase family)
MSPRLPRNVSGDDLVRLLGKFGYVVTRQKGSHFRLTTRAGGEHHITVPNHASLRAGTLNGILKDVAAHAGLSRDEVVKRLFE